MTVVADLILRNVRPYGAAMCDGGHQLGLGQQQGPEGRRPGRERAVRGNLAECPHGAPQGGLGDLVAAALDLHEHEGPALDAAQEGGQGGRGGGGGGGGRGSGRHAAFYRTRHSPGRLTGLKTLLRQARRGFRRETLCTAPGGAAIGAPGAP